MTEQPSALTAKQQAFALAYVETGNASEAYRQAYDVGEDTKPETVWSEASRTLADPKVAARVMELQEFARERTLVSVERLTNELEQARLLAMRDEKGAAAAVSAVMGKAKLHGLIIERAKTEAKVDINESAHQKAEDFVRKIMEMSRRRSAQE